MGTDADVFEPGGFATAFQQFLQRYQQLINDESEVRDRLTKFLGCEVDSLPTMTERLIPSELPNVQLAMQALAGDDFEDKLVGLPFELTYRDDFSLASYLAGRYKGYQVDACPPEFMNLAISADDHLPCVQIGIWFVEVEGQRAAVLVRTAGQMSPRGGLNIEVLAADRDHAARVLRIISDLREKLNVYRGKLISFNFNQYGMPEVMFHRVPTVAREDVILPEADLDAIERHTVGVQRRAEQLRAAGRHLKRGLLLYGPPGTGKTYSLMYLCNLMPERTTIIMGFNHPAVLGMVMAMARQLAPSAVVLEDVDLLAPERNTFQGGPPPFLFQVLNEMDGLAEDVDIIFGLTTNRIDALEPALADRPGRIDQAVEFRLPDPDHRRRLLVRYLQGVEGDPGDLEPVVTRTHGVSASFIKELVRRAVLLAAEADGDSLALKPGDLERALVDMSEHGSPVLRTILGASPASTSGGGYH